MELFVCVVGLNFTHLFYPEVLKFLSQWIKENVCVFLHTVLFKFNMNTMLIWDVVIFPDVR